MRRFVLIAIALWAGCGIPDKAQNLDLDTRDTDIVLFNDFERPSVGAYTLRSFVEDWGETPWELGILDGRAHIVDSEESFQGKSLRILYPKGQASLGKSGASWQIPLNQTFEELYCAYRLKLGEEFDFAQGGIIPGFSGGEGNIPGLGPHGRNGWSARMTWLANGQVAQQIYHLDQLVDYGEIYPWNAGGSHRLRSHVWHWVENRIVMNTPGKSDGKFMAWIDGKLALQLQNLRFRDVASLGIDTFFFSTYFGDDATSIGPVKDQFIYFDNLMIAIAPITH